MRAGSVLTPHDYVTNEQKRLGNRTYTRFGQCRLCASFLGSHLEHGETWSIAETTHGHYACVHAVLGGLKLADPMICHGTLGTHRNAIQLIFCPATQRGSGRVCGILQCSSTPRRRSAPLAAVCSLMHQRVLELEVLFEDHGVCSCTITDSLVLERVVHEPRALAQPQPAALELGNNQKGVQFQLDLTVTFAFPAHTSGFALQIFGLTHVWSNSDSCIIDFDHVLATAAADYIYIKLHFSPQRRYLHSLP